VLESRLKDSAYAGHSGELKLSFYRNGLLFSFGQGRIIDIQPWTPTPLGHSGDAGFPGLSFLQLVFGYRSFEELDDSFADCWSDNDNAFGLLSVLFPRQPSNVWPIA
jgi:hypothetical protein